MSDNTKNEKARRAERARYRRKRALEQGICTYCRSHWAEPGSSTCLTCREKRRGKQREYNQRLRASMSEEQRKKLNKTHYQRYKDSDSAGKKKLRERRKEQGLCIQCGQRPPEHNKTLCTECREKNLERFTARTKAKTPKERLAAASRKGDYEKRKSEELKAAGICYRCRVNKADHGYSTCAECREKQRERADRRKDDANAKARETYAWYKAHGICCKCGKYDAEPGRSLCLICKMDSRYITSLVYEKHKDKYREKRIEDSKNRRQFAKENGLCYRCMTKPADEGYKSCSRCRKMTRRYYNNVVRDRDGRLTRILFGDGDHCSSCGRPSNGKKLCPRCYENSLKAVEKARAAVNWENHPWKARNNALFGESKQKYGRFKKKK